MIRPAPVVAHPPLLRSALRVIDRRRPVLGVLASAGLVQVTVVMVTIVTYGALHHRHMADFHVMRDAAREILEGRSGGFVYPPPAAFLLIPFTFLPYLVAAAIWIALILASVPLMLLVLGVRDWRCHVLTMLAASTLAVVGSGSLSAFLALGTALVWKFRDRRVVAALLVGAVVVAKLYLWPLLVWFVAIRRARTAALGFATAAGLAFVGWAITGFAGLTDYPHRVSSVTALEQDQSYSPVALALSLGASTRSGQLLAGAIGLALLVAVFRAARRRDDERRSFVLAIAATFAFSPISWLHYFVLLAVPIAITSPRLAPLWVVPLGFWALPMKSGGELWRIALAGALTATIIAVARKRPASPITRYEGTRKVQATAVPPKAVRA
jgi:Glycosyltransferase family 87